ncbi:hypothetical protein OAF16_01210 [Flavobacteriales bacterium]|nr:hypothetical protein [Flavobacteriales bacterium]
MKKIIFLFIPLLLIGFVKVNSAQNLESKSLKINFMDIVSNDGLYYYNNQLFTGDFYSQYSSSGPDCADLNSFSQGSIVNGKRDGVWTWYEGDKIKRKTVYKNGIKSKNKGDNFVLINGNQYTVLN